MSGRRQLLSFLLMVHTADCLMPFLNIIFRAEPSWGSALRLGLVRHLRGGGEGNSQAVPPPEYQAQEATIKFLKHNVSKRQISFFLSNIQEFQNPMVVRVWPDLSPRREQGPPRRMGPR